MTKTHRTLTTNQILLLHSIRNGAQVTDDELRILHEVAALFPTHIEFREGNFAILTSAGRCAVRRSVNRVQRKAVKDAHNAALAGDAAMTARSQIELARTLIASALHGSGRKDDLHTREAVATSHLELLGDAQFRLGMAAGLLGAVGNMPDSMLQVCGYIQTRMLRYALNKIDKLLVELNREIAQRACPVL